MVVVTRWLVQQVYNLKLLTVLVFFCDNKSIGRFKVCLVILEHDMSENSGIVLTTVN